MSLILDALRRAERDRSSAQSPILIDPRMPDAGGARWPMRRWLLLACLLMVAIATVTWWRFSDAPPAKAVEVREAAATQSRAGPSPSLPAVIPAIPESTTTSPQSHGHSPAADAAIIPGTESVASLDDLAAESGGADDAARPASAEPETEVIDEDQAEPGDDPVPSPSITKKPAPPSEVEPSQVSAPATAEPVDPGAVAGDSDVPEKLRHPARLRTLREMPAGFRADFPAITINVHNFDPTPSRRFVLVDGKRYRESERLAAGPAVLEIVPEGMVLDYRGQRFIYALGRP